MASIFQNASTRMFCISGELSDIFCLPSGWIVNFEELLVQRLEQLGYQNVVFCSTQREMFYALDLAGTTAFDILRKTKATPPPPKAAPNPAPADTLGYDWLIGDAPSAPAETPSAPKTDDTLHYTCKVRADQLAVSTNRFMQDTEKPKALVFTSLEDLIKLSSTVTGRRLLEYFEEWKGLPGENRNICIFLSRTLGSAELVKLLHDNHVAVLESLFLKNGECNRNASFSVGAPMNDEITGLLELLRIQGHTFRDATGNERTVRLRFSHAQLPMLVRTLSFCNRGSGFTQLKIMKELLENRMESARSATLWLTGDVICQCYPDADGVQEDSDPMELLRSRKGWEPAYQILSGYITDHRAHRQAPEQAAPQSLGISRFEGDNAVRSRSAVPNFVLQGPPGVGKTEIASLIGRLLQREGILRSGHTVIGSRDKLVGEYVGSTAIKTAALIEAAQEGVLLVDEVYSIAEQHDNGISYCDEVFNTIVAAMTDPHYRFCVIFSGYADRMPEVWAMNEGLYSRFGNSNIITLHEYEPPLLQEIFEKRFAQPDENGRTVCLSEDVKAALPVFFANYYADRDRKHFGNARDIGNLVSEVKRAAVYRYLSQSEETVLPQVLTAERADFEDRAALFEKRGTSAADIFSRLDEYEGLSFLAEMFNDQLAIRVECEEKGIPYPGPSHMIWAGNPGTGKSTAAQLTAELYHSLGILGGTEPIYVDASEIVSQYAGGSAENIRKKMDEACQKNTVLVIEEAYQLLERGGTDAIHAMLGRMETDRRKFNLILILYRDKVDAFLEQNPGLASRLRIYTFPDYDGDQLCRIFTRMCEKAKDSIDEGGMQAVSAYLQELYRSGQSQNGNARLVRQLHESMKQRRYQRILGEMAMQLYGEDTPPNRIRAASARAMHTADVPDTAYLFTAADVPAAGEV